MSVQIHMNAFFVPMVFFPNEVRVKFTGLVDPSGQECTPPGLISFIFMQFSGKIIGQMILRVSAPSTFEKTWILHCTWFSITDYYNRLWAEVGL